ncbi:uncharacterized protein LACBIDRAFT_295685 [Laccaria bicolor S238N-H82]|uniref:Predicted protein n=1 Tax=Laccaria bicolor (strain S238N-H82 / ATCC MYA-4686) TaxID=486041 RepID=B0DX33_LACBS|nr:uncharacterized protein LACBIDRAFT_295685 [Laccaria bicolor S238N-H82]EDR00857.1 predicted protein [Laccaria bicolor S238N-H82]|eukprot:XP_001888451.1 predicted protein [Laccaria bicolor S238N-H82]
MLTDSSIKVVRVGATSGAEGGIFQYIPNTFNATNGTTVTFQFTGAPGNHTVTQSSFADPCDPLAGGFDSGWVSIPSSPALTAADTPEWNLTITDDTKRMVGAINAPTTGNKTFAAFEAAAKAFKGTPAQVEGGLVGVGASASAGVGPVPSGVKLFTASAIATTSTKSSAATTSGSAAAAPSSTSKSSDAKKLIASSFVVLLGTAIGISLA